MAKYLALAPALKTLKLNATHVPVCVLSGLPPDPVALLIHEQEKESKDGKEPLQLEKLEELHLFYGPEKTLCIDDVFPKLRVLKLHSNSNLKDL